MPGYAHPAGPSACGRNVPGPGGKEPPVGRCRERIPYLRVSTVQWKLPGIYLARTVVAALLALGCAAGAIWLASGRRGRALVQVGGALLVLVALFAPSPALCQAPRC